MINSRLQIRLGEHKVQAQCAANVGMREICTVLVGGAFGEGKGGGVGGPGLCVSREQAP